MSESNAPYLTLGKHLKYVREQLHLSVAEVSGAVEIDQEQLERIEAGTERPAEDILLLLISHFGVQDREALQLWELADYDGEIPEQFKSSLETQLNKSVVMLVTLDPRAVYSDGLDIAVAPAGITLGFTQAASQSQTMPVARVGMSFDQAAQVMRAIEQALLRARYSSRSKLLPPPQTRQERQ